MSSVTVVNLMTSSYSGATWLTMVLGSHTQTFAVGEIDHLVKRKRRSCSTHGESCPVWSQIETRDDPQLYLDIAAVTGKRILIVAKARRLLEAQRDPRIEQRFVFMPRDGRAVVASRMRKYKDVGIWEASRWWSRSIRKKERIVRREPADRVLDLRYEDVLADQPTQIARICEFLRLDYEPAMLDWAAHEHHFIGGNSGVQATHRRVKGVEPVATDREDDAHTAKREKIDAYYKQQDPKQFVDERWRSELTPMQLRLFALRAGRTNRRYRYPSGWPWADPPPAPEPKEAV